MDFEFTEEQQIIRENVKKFAETELLPHANRIEEKGLPADIFPRLAQMGLLVFALILYMSQFFSSWRPKYA